MIRLNCDYLEGCHPDILDALARTNLEQTVGYGLRSREISDEYGHIAAQCTQN